MAALADPVMCQAVGEQEFRIWSVSGDTLLWKLRHCFRMLNVDGVLFLAVEKVSPVICRERAAFASRLAAFFGLHGIIYTYLLFAD